MNIEFVSTEISGFYAYMLSNNRFNSLTSNSSKEPDISDWKHCLYGGAFFAEIFVYYHQIKSLYFISYSIEKNVGFC
jgi:hypothetical protein